MNKEKSEQRKGFITIEIMLALTLFALVFGAILSVSLSNQNISIDIAQSAEALRIAQKHIDDTRSLSAKDYKLVVNSPTVSIGQFSKSMKVMSLPNAISKQVTVEVAWSTTLIRNRSVSLSTLLYETNKNADTCSSTLEGDWSAPKKINAIDALATLVGDSGGVYPITDIDAHFGTLYVSINNSARNTPTIFWFDTSNPSPGFISSLDNDPVNSTGVSAITVAKLISGTYIFTASASSFTKGQLQIINTQPPYNVVTYKIPTSIVRGSSTQGIGNKIFYSNGYIYLGLTKTVSGPELNIIDVHDIQNPMWVGGYTIGNGVNSIFVKGDYAYVASPNSQELITLNVANPSAPFLVGGYDAPDNVGNGKSVYFVGDTLYFGRTLTSQNPEFVILDNASPETFLQTISTVEVGSSVNGLFIRDHLAFIQTNSEFQIFDIKNLNNIVQFANPLRLANFGGSPAPTLECEGNHFYIGSNDSSNKGYISVITAN